MQGLRKYAVVVCLTAALSATPAVAEPSGSPGDGIFSRLLAFFGIVLHSRWSIPPGAPAQDDSRLSTPPGDTVAESRFSIPPG
jgi:hypothetical protein